jgi:hypothetical protein
MPKQHIVHREPGGNIAHVIYKYDGTGWRFHTPVALSLRKELPSFALNIDSSIVSVFQNDLWIST